MTFNEDVSVADVFDKVYRLVLGQEKQGGSIIEICYAIGLPVGILVFIIISAGEKLRMTRHRFRLKCTHMRSR